MNAEIARARAAARRLDTVATVFLVLGLLVAVLAGAAGVIEMVVVPGRDKLIGVLIILGAVLYGFAVSFVPLWAQAHAAGLALAAAQAARPPTGPLMGPPFGPPPPPTDPGRRPWMSGPLS